jgi:hypothetical protein
MDTGSAEKAIWGEGTGLPDFLTMIRNDAPGWPMRKTASLFLDFNRLLLLKIISSPARKLRSEINCRLK